MTIQALHLTGPHYGVSWFTVRPVATAGERRRSAKELVRVTPLQQELARRLERTAADTGGRLVVYRTAYLGYLPFGQYHSVTVGGEDVSLACPYGWE